MAASIRHVAIATAAIVGTAFFLPASAFANGDSGFYRLGSSKWDPSSDFRWAHGPSIAWYYAGNNLYNGSYSYGPYGTWGYGPLRDCGWNWRTHVNRHGHLIATSARCY